MIRTDITSAVQRVEPEYYLREYDDVLMGRRKTYSSALMAKEQGAVMCAELLRDIFKYYLKWSPIEIRDKLTPEVVAQMKIQPLIKRIPCPPEVDAQKELYYVAWYLYPETRNVKEPELIIKLYTDIINGKVKKFPSGYFDGNAGYLRARILFLTMVREFLPPFTSLDGLYGFFASSEGKKCINHYKLTIPLRELYGSALAYLHDALPWAQKSEILYEKYRKQIMLNREKGNYLPVTQKEREALLKLDTRMADMELTFEGYEEVESVLEEMNLDEIAEMAAKPELECEEVATENPGPVVESIMIDGEYDNTVDTGMATDISI